MTADPFREGIADHVRRLVDHVPSMLGYWDSDLRCRFANRAYERWFGVDPDALIGRSIDELLGPELYAQNEPYIRGALGGEEQLFERIVPGPDGAKRHSLARYIPDIVDGRVVGFMAEVTDVTRLKSIEDALRAEVVEHQRALELLRRSEAGLREAQRLGRIGSWEWDMPTGRTTWSPQLYAIFGYDPSEPPPPATAGRGETYPPDSLAIVQAAVVRTMNTGEPFTLEVEYRRCGGGGGWIEARGEVVRGDDGTSTGLRGTVTEITERRQMQEARLQRDVAEVASRNKTQFLSRVSHELRTPLNAILGFAQLLEIDPALGEKHRAWGALIRNSGQHMLDLIDEILDLSSAELGQLRLACSRMDLAEVVRAALVPLSQLAEGAHVRLVDALPTQPLWVVADPRRVRQVVHNLLSNAIKYGRAGGRVTVSARSGLHEADLCVQDDGIGMDEAQLQRLFTPFDRLGAEATAVPGSGLGLALSRHLVELMGGRIEARSRAAEGSLFTVTLPAADPSAAPPGPPQ
ncbi:PAS domain-containing protein [Rhizobacter sp. J219]|uniref:sensor histidine kinase n=1 Tax=Rhizobacter sp. J219 TaxID=2898430 RepID=UPI0021511593|nr:ATP-binding protein [Rhizobacter sp. J219]MCR5884933.1 PAS domain-containing protein [Rhizobacter sp. J219]